MAALGSLDFEEFCRCHRTTASSSTTADRKKKTARMSWASPRSTTRGAVRDTTRSWTSLLIKPSLTALVSTSSMSSSGGGKSTSRPSTHTRMPPRCPKSMSNMVHPNAYQSRPDSHLINSSRLPVDVPRLRAGAEMLAKMPDELAQRGKAGAPELARTSDAMNPGVPASGEIYILWQAFGGELSTTPSESSSCDSSSSSATSTASSLMRTRRAKPKSVSFA
mmetsp:Transcript_102541/g.289582  ORF Transcript_102541/g.289582 Transcript_102541/m.289582 type:complete len:221 (+) Transcript_102541:123-785(+)